MENKYIVAVHTTKNTTSGNRFKKNILGIILPGLLFIFSTSNLLALSGLTVTTSQTNITTCHGVCTGVASVNATGGTPGYTYLWAPGGGTGATISSLCAGSYTCTVTDAASSTVVKTITITEPAAIAIDLFSQTSILCHGNSTGSANINMSGGTGAYTYTWSTGSTSGLGLTNLTAGPYTVTVTDANACTASSVITITEPTALAISFPSHSNISCNGGSNGSAAASVTGGTGAHAYSWSTGSTAATVTGLGVNTYTVKVTDDNGCTSTATTTITQPTVLTASISSHTDIFCNGSLTGSAIATASGGTIAYSYAWSSAGTGATAYGLSAGPYTVTVTDGNGCTKSTNVTITEPSNAVSVSTTSQTNILCNGNATGKVNISASGGTGSLTYSWSNGSTSSTSISNLVAGPYSVTVTDANGCSKVTNATITTPPALTASISSQTNILCHGNSTGSVTIAATGGNGAYTYSWSTGNTTATATNLSAVTFTVTVMDANGCTKSTNSTITEPSTAITATMSHADIACGGTLSGFATATASGGTGALTYNWSTGNTTASISGVGANTYTVSITDGNSCLKTLTVTITQPAAIVASISASASAICKGSNTVLTPNVSGGTGALTYSWSTGATTSSSQTVAPTSNTTYSLAITDANACSKSTSQLISVSAATPAQPGTISGNVKPCPNTAYTYSVTAVAGATSYTWTIPSGWSGASTTNSINATSNSANGTFSVTATNACGTSTPTTLNVNVSIPVYTAETTAGTICSGTSTSLYVDDIKANLASIAWSPSADLDCSTCATPNATPGSTTTYTAICTDINGCSMSTTVVVNVNTTPSAPQVSPFSVGPGICQGDSIELVSGGTIGWHWNTGATTKYIWVKTAGTFSAHLIDNGCQSGESNILTTTVNSLPVVTYSIGHGIGVDTLCSNGASVTIDGTVNPTGGMYMGGAALTGNSFNPATANLGWNFIQYMYTDLNGCSASAKDSILVDVCTGVNSIATVEKLIDVYPNPATGSFVVNTPNTIADLITVTDVLGRVVMNVKPLVSMITLDISAEKNGVYFVKVVKANDHEVLKLIKQ